MNNESKMAEDVFDRALQIPIGERAAFVLGACSGDEALKGRVKALLSAHEQDSRFLPGGDSIETVTSDVSASEETGMLIGRYKLLEKLGEGGFGSVWAAEQREPVKRRVALKIIKLGMDTKQVVARFEAERQALALMDHPNIAKVLDAGTTDTGRPYFVMELVKGIPITKYFEQEGTKVTEKLQLFMRVCQAIQHAHQKGIIHRDIKPSNVMVTLHDGEPVPKVIDFGIAKATQGELTDKTIYTQYSQFIGTPAYMSPEQAEMSGLDIDTRSDVYSLGVLLYELLTGGTPFDSQELMASGIDEMRKIIREREPVKPSTRVSQSLSSDFPPSSGVRVDSISSDLDWIVMKCLQKDRSRRYETSNGLAMDLQRYLADEPILARPPSLGYRLQKTYRRNQFLVIGATAVALFLVIGLVAASYSWNREKVARMEAEEAKVEAETNQRIAVQAKEKADQFAADARRSVYVADMNLAALALARNNLGKARGLLVPYREDPKFAGKLGWEWRYLWQEVNATEETDQSKHHDNALTAVSFLGDSSRVVSGSYDGTVKIWDRNTDDVETLFQLEFARIRTLAVTPNGREVGIVWEDRAKAARVKHAMGVFDSVSGSEIARYNSQGSGNQHRTVRFLGDGSRLLMNQNERAWYLVDRETGSKELLFEARRGPMAVSEGEEFVVVSQGRRTIQIIHLDSSRQKIEVDTGERFDALAASSVSGLVASGHFLNPVIKLFESQSGDLVRELSGHSAWVSSLAFSPDGRWLYSGSADQTIRIWDVSSGELLKTYRGHTDEVWSLDVSPDGVTLVSGGKDGSVRLWPVVPSFGRDPIDRFINDIEFPVLARAPGGDAAIICGVDRSDPTLVRFFELGADKVLNKRVFRSQDGPVKQVALAWDSRLSTLDAGGLRSKGLLEVDRGGPCDRRSASRGSHSFKRG